MTHTNITKYKNHVCDKTVVVKHLKAEERVRTAAQFICVTTAYLINLGHLM